MFFFRLKGEEEEKEESQKKGGTIFRRQIGAEKQKQEAKSRIYQRQRPSTKTLLTTTPLPTAKPHN